MKDVVTVEINAPVTKVAGLFADPQNHSRWMEDTQYQPVSGDQGAPGSKFILIQKKGDLTFEATVVARDLPKASQLVLESPTVVVEIKVTFLELDPGRTRLTSKEMFAFRNLSGKIFGLLARRSIRRAHRRQMESFKRFAESVP